LALWFCGAFPTMAAAVAWQNWYVAGRDAGHDAAANRECTWAALGGLLASIVAAVWYVVSLEPGPRAAWTAPLGLVYLIGAIAGLLVQGAAWFLGRKASSLTTTRLLVVSAGCLLTITCTSVLREIRRLAAIDLAMLYDLHADASRVGGLVTFLVFALLNMALITWCVFTVRRERRNDSPAPSPSA
jgi:hypothetical protein